MKKAFNFRSVLVCVLVLIMCLTAFVACDKNKQPDLSGLENAKSQMYQTYKKLDNSIQTSDFYLVKAVVVGDKTYSIDWSYEVLEGPAENVSLVVDSDKANAVKFVINGQASAETKFVIKGVVKDNDGHQLTIVDNGFTIKVPKFNTATYAEFVAMCKENGSSINENSKSCAVLAYIIGVNCNGSSMGSVWAMDKDGNGYYIYSPKYPEGFTKTREALNEYLPIGAEVVINGTPTLQFGATLQFNKNATIEKTGNTAADKNVTLDYIDATEAWSNATDIKDTALENFQARRVELKGITMGRQDGNDWYFTVGGVEFICRSNIYLMTEEDQKALEAKWVVGGKANIKGIVNVYSQKYQVYPDSVDAIEAIAQTDEEAVAGVKASLALEASYEDNFTLPTSDAATVTWAIKSGTGAVIGENNLVTITRADADQKVVFTATIRKGEVTDTKDFEITIPAIVAEDPNTVILTTKSLKLENGKYQESPTDGVTVNGVTFAFKEIGYYDADIQTRNKNNKASAIWNTTAFNKPIKEIIIKLSAGKAGFSNNNTHSIKFGNAVNGADNIQQLSTVKDQYEYVITPDAATYTFFTFEQNETYTYSSYFESITIVYAEEKSDTDKVAEAKAALTLDVTSTGVSFKLPLVGENGATISWTSSNTDVITINGEDAVVTAPAAETTVKLTATITVGEAQDTKEFDVTVTVTIPEFDVTITQPAAGGTVEVKNGTEAIASGKFQQGTVLTITATPADANHELVAIKVNGTAIEAVDGVYSVTVNAAVEITAEFREIKYATVTIGAVENGTLTVKNGEADVENNASLRDGTVLTITATANAGYKVSAIKVNGAAITGNTYTITGEVETIEITAELKALPEWNSKVEGAEIKTFAELEALIPNANDSTTEMYYTMGYIKNITNTTFGNCVIYDLDGNEFTVYGLYDYAGSTKYGDLTITKPVADDFVVVYGTLKNYNGTKEMMNARICQHNDTIYAPTFAKLVDDAKNALNIETEYGKNFDLPENGLNDTKISWVSDNTEIVNIAENPVDGKFVATVVVPATDTVVNLTATISKGTAQDTKVFTITIKATSTVTVNYSVEGGNGTIAVTLNKNAIESGAEIASYSTITVTVTPDEGYRLASYTIGETVTPVVGKTSFELTITENTTFTVKFEAIPAGPELVATFALGDNGNATHDDGASKTTYTETVGDYTLSISAGSNFYTGARDAKGNSCLKLGTSSKVGTFTIAVPTGVKKVVIYVSGYKAKTSKYTINGGDVKTATKKSDNGEYEAVEITVPEDGKIVFASATGATRIMINTIEFYA